MQVLQIFKKKRYYYQSRYNFTVDYGVYVFKSSNVSIWPIFVGINENILLTRLWYGTEKTNV